MGIYDFIAEGKARNAEREAVYAAWVAATECAACLRIFKKSRGGDFTGLLDHAVTLSHEYRGEEEVREFRCTLCSQGWVYWADHTVGWKETILVPMELRSLHGV
jgi:hypothetical protein